MNAAPSTEHEHGFGCYVSVCRESVVLTREQANAICETLIAMAKRLPMRHRNHYDALVALGWEPYGSD